MIIPFILPGLISTILNIPPDDPYATPYIIEFPPPRTDTPANATATTTTPPDSIIRATDFCTLITSSAASASATGASYHYQCGTSTAAIDVAVSGTSTTTYPGDSSNTAPPQGFTQVSASDGHVIVVTTTTASTSGNSSATPFRNDTTATAPATFTASLSTSGASSSSEASTPAGSAPSASATHSGARSEWPLPHSYVSLAVAVGMAVVLGL